MLEGWAQPFCWKTKKIHNASCHLGVVRFGHCSRVGSKHIDSKEEKIIENLLVENFIQLLFRYFIWTKAKDEKGILRGVSATGLETLTTMKLYERENKQYGQILNRSL